MRRFSLCAPPKKRPAQRVGLFGYLWSLTICPAYLELYDSLAIHLETNGNDHLKIIVILTAADLPSSLCLNYSEFPNSYLLCQLSVRINLFDMFIDGGGVQHHTMPPSYSASTRYSYPHTGFHSWHRSHQWRLQKSDIPLPNLNSCREFTAWTIRNSQIVPIWTY